MAWLDAKAHRSGSTNTARAYRDTLDGFRAVLQPHGLDLAEGDSLLLLRVLYQARLAALLGLDTP